MMKVLLLSSDTGEGHNSAATALQHSGREAGLDVLTRRPLEESGRINSSLAGLYNVLLTHHPQWICHYFSFLERFRPNERNGFYSSVRPYIGAFLKSVKPDVLLSVHPMLNHFIQRYIKEEQLDVPCYTLVTDPFPPFWRGWASPYVDGYFVASDEALQALTALGVSAWQIDRVAMPVRPQFMPASLGEIDDLNRTLKLRESSTILINGGARGGGPLARIYQIVRKAAQDSNILVVCGRNSRLRWHIEKLQDSRTRTFGFLEDIHRYVAASDLVITKPGAMATYEALACGVPVALLGIRGLMPQESGLFQAAVRYDFGFAAGTFKDLERVIRLGPSEWNRKRECVHQFYRASSGEQLIERIQPAHVGA
jgi:UDP-N-acetylglucosamine:LPS N-acetylglucosamine transferase